MAIARIKEVNAAIAKLIDPRIELVKGEGYFYFQFDDQEANRFETHSIMTPRITDQSKEQWIRDAREFADKVCPKELDHVTELLGDDLRYLKGPAIPEHAEEVASIRDALLRRANEYKDADKPELFYELKKFEVTHLEGSSVTYLVIELGMVNDEGTMASILCRNYRHISIHGTGRRKGYHLLNAKKKTESKGYWNVLHALTR